MNIRPLRGRALIRKHPEDCGGEYSIGAIVIPANSDPCRTDRDKQFSDRSKRRIHRGTVVALGEPPYVTNATADAPTRPWHVEVGQEVWYIYALALEKVRSFDDVVWVAAEEVQAVSA